MRYKRKIEEQIVQEYGILVPLDGTAKLLHRSVHGLRVMLSSDSEIARLLRPVKIRLGRRVLFSAAGLAAVIVAGMNKTDANEEEA